LFNRFRRLVNEKHLRAGPRRAKGGALRVQHAVSASPSGSARAADETDALVSNSTATALLTSSPLRPPRAAMDAGGHRFGRRSSDRPWTAGTAARTVPLRRTLRWPAAGGLWRRKARARGWRRLQRRFPGLRDPPLRCIDQHLRSAKRQRLPPPIARPCRSSVAIVRCLSADVQRILEARRRSCRERRRPGDRARRPDHQHQGQKRSRFGSLPVFLSLPKCDHPEVVASATS